MRSCKGAALCLAVAAALMAATSASASAALPELGRCVAVEGVSEGKKVVYHGVYKSKSCTKESTGRDTGRYEWLPGPGAAREWESIGTEEPVTLETVSGTSVVCANHFAFGEYTGAKTETAQLSLRHCEDTALHKPCQSIAPEGEQKATVEGQVESQPLTGELGFIRRAGHPLVGWDFKATNGPYAFVFECGSTVGLGTKVAIEGSFIGQVRPIDKVVEEFKGTYRALHGHQVPEGFEGAAKDTLTANFLVGLEPVSEQIGYSSSAVEEVSALEGLEIKAM